MLRTVTWRKNIVSEMQKLANEYCQALNAKKEAGTV